MTVEFPEMNNSLDNYDTEDKPMQVDKTEYLDCTNKVIHGDCMEVMKNELANMQFDMLLSDPPYNISKSYICEKQISYRSRRGGGKFIMPKGNFGEWDHGFSKKWASLILPRIKNWVLFFCDQKEIGTYCNMLVEQKFVGVGSIVWHKTNPVPFNHKFKLLNAWEGGVVAKRPSKKFYGKSVHNVFTYKSPSPHERKHPTQKPLKLIEEFIKLFTKEGDVILDPFAGSGTTGIACKNTGRNYILIEKEQKYIDVMHERGLK